MRPDPRGDRNASQSGRIIYLGDVRKRRRSRRQTPDRYYLLALALVDVMSWAAWLAVVMTLTPARILTYVAFFTPLGIAIAASSAIGFYGVDWRRGIMPSLRVCVRRGMLVSIVIVINLACLGARFWLLPVAAVTVAAAVLLEVALRARV